MACTKCGGLVIQEHDEDRCINCGRRPYDTQREVDPIPVKEAITVGAAWTPERRAKFEATVAARQAAAHKKIEMPKRRKESAVTDVAPEKAAVPARPEQVHVLPAAGSAALAGLDESIARMKDDLAALERAREIVARGSR